MLAFVAIFANLFAKLDQSGNRDRNYNIVSTALGVCSGLAVSRIVFIIIMCSKKQLNFINEPLQVLKQVAGPLKKTHGPDTGRKRKEVWRNHTAIVVPAF